MLNKKIINAVVILSLFQIFSCSNDYQMGGNKKNMNNQFSLVRMKLMEDVHRNGALIIYGTQDSTTSAENKKAAVELTRNYFWFKSKIIADTSVNDELLKSNSFFPLYER